MFYIDSLARNIYYFDYDETTGELSNQRVFYTVPEEEGSPDGCTMDEHGYLWFALWGGSAVVRLNPEGEVDASIPMPAQKITSICFGGAGLNTMFVTSEGGNARSDSDLLAGATFSANCRVSGMPEFRSRIAIG